MTANFAMRKIIPNDKLTDVLCLSCFQMQVELNLLCYSHLLEACLNFEGCQVQGVKYPRVCSHSTVCPNNLATSQLKSGIDMLCSVTEMKLYKEK